MIVELKKGVYWVGVTDWELRRFHGHELSTHRGSTYNSYLITDEKTVLVDTVWEPFQDQFIENVHEVVDPSKIDIVVANHAEVDHSGGLPLLMKHAPGATVVVSKRGVESVKGHYHEDWKFRGVGTGERINIGKHELMFVEAPMLHWPDSMFTYLTGENILMSNDAFGQHYATAFHFNDQVNEEELYEEALKYYVNILTPFSNIVLKKIEELLALSLPIDMIAPSHGVIWRRDPLQIVRKFQEWASQKPEPTAVILYDTMWNGTRRMAEAIAEGFISQGVACKVYNAAATDRNDMAVEVFKSRTVVLGSPTFNHGILPTLGPLMEELNALKLQNKLGAAFGCYGWSGESVKIIEDHLARCGIKVVREGLRAKWRPGAEDVAACRAFGRELAKITTEGS